MADATPGFAHLHNHTTYSLLDGAQRLDEMCARAAADGQCAIAITDHGNLFGAMSFARKAAEHRIQPIIGLEAYVAPGSRHERQGEVVAGLGRKNYFHLVLLATSYVGYKNLVKLASAGFLEGFYYRPRIDKALLEQHHEGLICLSACLAGEVPALLARELHDEARRVAGWYRELFGDRYWLEVQDHGLPEQTRVNHGIERLAAELGIGIVATNDCHYLLPEDHAAHDALICIQTGTTVRGKSGMSYSPHHYLKTRAEMAERFPMLPQAVAASAEIAERCRFAFEKPSLQLPEFPVPAGHDLDGYFEHVVREGFASRLPDIDLRRGRGEALPALEVYRERLEREIKMVRGMGFAGYFLITWDFIRYAREAGIPVGPGRGSAAGSLVAYSLRITNVDPLQYGLLFERFLNPERVTMPDIDIDFCFRRREHVIEYVTQKYGQSNVAQIITFGTMAARAVIRDVGRVLEVPYGVVDRIAKLVPAVPGQEITIREALEQVPPLKQAYDQESEVKEMLDLAQRLEGLTRHASTHAAGVVIAPRPIVEFAPLYRGTKEGDEVTTQYSKDEIEEIGLLKLDFLGLKTLTLIDDARASIAAATGVRPELDDLPLDDKAVYELFARGKTDGIFQFESAGMKDILRRLKPERFEDLIALNALYRPGPLGGGLVDDFIKRRHGKVKVSYPHPRLAEILEETYGVIVYQEQVMQIASVLGGYSMGEADILRRAMGKKNQEAMNAEAERFVERAAARQVDRRKAQKVFELMAHFAGYGFNKSHSAAYALIAYHTAWLKVHHPVHFMAAILTNDKGNTDKLVQYIGECREMGIEVAPPDVNTSGVDFTVEERRIRFGLSAIKNVGESAIRSILAARDKLGCFAGLHELCAEVDLRLVNKRVLEALVQSGALDSFGASRSQLFAAVDLATDFGQKRRAEREAGQGSLFGGGGSAAEPPRLPDLPDWDATTRLGHEKASLGFYVTGHPLTGYSDVLQSFATERVGALAAIESGKTVAVAGIASAVRRRKSRNGEWWASLKLEDLDGHVEVLIFPRAYASCEREVEDERALFISGRVETEEERPRIIAEEVCPLDELLERRADGVEFALEAGRLDDELVERLRGAMAAHRGEAAVYFAIEQPGGERIIMRAGSSCRVLPSRRLTREIEELIGPDRVRYRPRPRTEPTGRGPQVRT